MKSTAEGVIDSTIKGVTDTGKEIYNQGSQFVSGAKSTAEGFIDDTVKTVTDTGKAIWDKGADIVQGVEDAYKDHQEKPAREQIAKDSTSHDASTTDEDSKLVQDEIVKTVPLKELEAIKKAGVKVKVTNGGVATYRPSLNDNLPRGHVDTWSTVAGVYLPDTKEVVVATHANADGSRALPGKDQSSSEDVVAHEMAHAYNATGTDADGKAQLLSDQDDFKKAYDADGKTGHLNDPYYHQPDAGGNDSSGGRDEGFAESNAMYRTDPDGMKKTHPNLYKYWHDRLGG
jgi:hypothetical protein